MANADQSVSEAINETAGLSLLGDTEDLSALDWRVAEHESICEALLKDLKAHGETLDIFW